MTEVFVDYDGTITDQDTFDVLVSRLAGETPWRTVEQRLTRGDLSIRDALQIEASYVHLTLEEADALLEEEAGFDPTFAAFVARCRAQALPLTIVSSGVKPLIERALARHRLSGVPVVANEVVRAARGGGWVLVFADDVPNGTDKARLIRAARERGARTIFIGDGRSDYDAALLADVRFAKRGRRLAQFLEEKKVDFSTFSSFDQIVLAAPA